MKIKFSVTVLVLLAMVSALFGACAKEAAPASPEAKGEIVIGILDDLSGPTASTCSAHKDGTLDAIRYINEEKGGILGHQLRAIVIDCKMDSTISISGWDRLKSEKVPFIVSQAATVVKLIVSAANRDHIPITAISGDIDQLFPKEPSFFFTASSHYPGVVESVVKRMEKDWAEKGETRSPKVGYDILSFGIYPKMLGKALKMSTEKRDWEHITTGTGLTPADVTTQVLQMKEFGIDYVGRMGSEAGDIAWIKELDRQNFHPVVLGGRGLGSEELWNACGELLVGVKVYANNPLWTDNDVPLISLIQELNAKWYPDITKRASSYIAGFAEFLVVAEAMERAIDKVGYENLDGDAMKTAMETIRDFDPGIGTGYTWTPTDHQGIRGHNWYEWTGEGILTPISDWVIFDPLPEEQRILAWWLK